MKRLNAYDMRKAVCENVKKVGLTLFAASVLLCSCDKNNSKPTEEEEKPDVSTSLIDEFINSKTNVGNGIVLGVAEGETPTFTAAENNTFVGYGINIFNGPTFADAMLYPLLANKVYAAESQYITIQKYYEGRSEISIRENLSDVYSNMDIDVKAECKVAKFGANVSASYGSRKQVKSQSKFYKNAFSFLINKHQLKMSYVMTDEDKAKMFDPKVLSIINNPAISPQSLFENVGTHVITGCGTGGSATIAAIYDSEESVDSATLAAALSVSYGVYSGSVRTNYSSSEKNCLKNTNITVTSSGGTKKILCSGLTGEEALQSLIPQLKEWAETIEANPVLGKVYSVMPIWDLATDPARKAEIITAFTAKAAEINGMLANYFSKESTTPEALIVSGRTYEFTNWVTQTKFGAPDKNNSSLLKLQETFSPAEAAQWELVQSTAYPGYYMLKNKWSERILDLRNASEREYFQQYFMNGTDAQLFRIIDNGDGTVSLRNKKYDYENFWVVPTSDRQYIRLENRTGLDTKWKIKKMY
ncbi:MAG: RICIN domain-containing protein [Bacteroidales bacterium]|jgi:predicted DNA-binding protein (MmcQ/YjbR family)|nr:RICIN domain-containing protein [Bacteroidales bacterium]